MKAFTDWNCRLLPGFPDQIATPERAADALAVLHERTGINRFSFLPIFDPESDSVSAFRIRSERSLKALQSLLRFPATLFASASVRLLPDLSEYLDLRQFFLPKTDYLPISLPLAPDEWIENALAELSRHASFRILLTNAHLLPVFYPQPLMERILNLPNLAFQFSFQSLLDPKNDRFLHPLLDRRVPILVGSGVNSIEKAYRLNLIAVVSAVRSRFYPFEADEIFFGKRIFRKRS